MFLIDFSSKHEFQLFDVQTLDFGGGVQTAIITTAIITTTRVLGAEDLGGKQTKQFSYYAFWGAQGQEKNNTQTQAFWKHLTTKLECVFQEA